MAPLNVLCSNIPYSQRICEVANRTKVVPANDIDIDAGCWRVTQSHCVGVILLFISCLFSIVRNSEVINYYMIKWQVRHNRLILKASGSMNHVQQTTVILIIESNTAA